MINKGAKKKKALSPKYSMSTLYAKTWALHSKSECSDTICLCTYSN